MFLVAVTPRVEHNGNDTSLSTAGSFPELAAARLPPTSEGALASEASWGQLSPQGHGWVSLSLCETTVFGSSSTKNWEKKKNPHPFLPSGELVDTSQNMCAICTQLWSAGTPPSAHLSGVLRASRLPSGGLLRQGECPAERHDFPFLLLLLSRHGWAPYSVAMVGLILQAMGFYLTCASEDEYLHPHASRQGRDRDDTCVGVGYQWLSKTPASSSSTSST